MSSETTRLVLGFAVLAAAFLGPGPTPAATGATLADLAWLAGHWRAEHEGVVTEEIWTPAAGGMMLGLNRQYRPGGRAAFEYLRIEEVDGGIDYVASPGGRAPTRYRLARSGERSAAFHNPEHDWPQALEYRLDEAGVMHVRAAGLEPGSQELAWTMERASSEQ